MDWTSGDRRTALVAALTAVSWIGLYAHNAIEFPELPLWRPENAGVAAVAAALFLLWFRFPGRFAHAALLGWGLFHLVGGALLSILPLGFLPFVPEQTLTHYVAHLVYGLAQLPLVGTLAVGIGRRGEGG